jgi:AmmeMemoRadiSam system protein B
MSNWYPQDKKELNNLLEKFLSQKTDINLAQQIHGLIVPHAGYEFSGEVAGKAYSLLKQNKNKKAIILSPSHYTQIDIASSHNETEWITPLGKIKVNQQGFPKQNISQEHAIDNQIPFLQKLGFKEILPLVIGEINQEEAKEIAEKLIQLGGILIISTDLSHFLNYEEAKKKDKETIKTIEEINTEKLEKIENNACGVYPLMIALELCKIKKYKPKLIEYKNSGDLTGDKDGVVGYASLVF